MDKGLGDDGGGLDSGGGLLTWDVGGVAKILVSCGVGCLLTLYDGGEAGEMMNC